MRTRLTVPAGHQPIAVACAHHGCKMGGLLPLAALVAAVAAGIALLFRPFAVLRSPQLRVPWLAALVLVPLLWGAERLLPGGPLLQLSGACLLVLMFGWPLAVWTLALAAAITVGAVGVSVERGVELLAWHGILPATLALAFGLALRRFLPPHAFVYILGRAFFGTAIALSASGALATLVAARPAGSDVAALLVAHWLIAWGEAVLTGMLTAIFVAFKPAWLLTWSDRRYLAPKPKA